MMRASRTIFTGSLVGNGIIGIRREDKNVWERRVALTPKHVGGLLKRGTVKKIVVQPSSIRCFDDRAYEEVGAMINEDLSEASTIVAVKEVPAQLLIPHRNYLFFSHVIKAQSYNMPLLDTILEKDIRLFDYEKFVNEDGRMVKFGPYAGYAGTIDTLHALGLALLTRGYATPFLHLSLSKEYSSLDVARHDLREIGNQIRARGLPEAVCPLTIGITGAGSVSTAAQQILHLLPVKYVEVEDLPKIWNAKKKDTHNIYVVVIRSKDMVVPRDTGKRFSKRDYYSKPEDFVPIYHETVAPYLRVLINGMYWEPRFPRLLTTVQASELLEQNRFPLLCLGEITCDVGGSVEFFVKATTIQNPFYVYNLKTDSVVEMHQFNGEGVIILGVDHIPAEFPKEASTDFGNGLEPLVEKIAVSDGTLSLEDQRAQLGPECFNAIITNRGKLTPNFEYIAKLRAVKDEKARVERKQILVLGAGMTSGPCVEHLLGNQKNVVTLADTNRNHLDRVMSVFGKAPSLNDDAGGMLRCVTADANQMDSYIVNLIKRSDLVVSLLPAHMHARIAEQTIKQKTPLVTASYISPEMEKLRAEASEKGALVINELGLDPGIDIMTTAKLLSEIRQQGGIVTSYVSLCGALPQPENSDCPMGYKFSWSPRGVLGAASRPAKFFAKGKWYELAGERLFYATQPYPGFKGLHLRWLPNGNSQRYVDCYELGDPKVDTIIRGTLRYGTFAPVVNAFRALGLLDERTPLEELSLKSKRFATWPQLIGQLLASSSSSSELINAIAAKLSKEFTRMRQETAEDPAAKVLSEIQLSREPVNERLAAVSDEVSQIISQLGMLGLLDESNMVPKTESGLPIDSLCETLSTKLIYKSHERDFVMMIHRIRAHFPKTGKNRIFRATLSVRGDDIHRTATAVTVGLPVAAAAQLVLDSPAIASKTGFMIPTDPQLYKPILALLEQRGIKMQEDVYDEY